MSNLIAPSKFSYRKCSRAFTLVELLVVIAIIGILVALLLPAVQSARESARRTQCKNQVKNIALGCLLHEDAHKHFPTGGWAYWWSADPNRGYGEDQPGSWAYSILPYVEQETLHDLGKGLTATREVKAASIALHQTPVSLFNCPTRRAPRLYRSSWGRVEVQDWLTGIAATEGVAKSDYAANSGEALRHSGDQLMPAASSYAAADSAMYPVTGACDQGGTGRDRNPHFINCQSGVMFFRSALRRSRIMDGSANTYLVGEKFLEPERYEYDPDNTNTFSYGDNQSIWTGYEWDNHRVAWNSTLPVADQEDFQPSQDRDGNANILKFGSAHAGGFNMAFCDGSIHLISYDIDPETHRRLASRLDGEVVDKDSL